MSNPHTFRYFKTSPEIIRLAVIMYVRYPLSWRNVEDLLHEYVSTNPATLGRANASLIESRLPRISLTYLPPPAPQRAGQPNHRAA